MYQDWFLKNDWSYYSVYKVKKNDLVDEFYSCSFIIHMDSDTHEVLPEYKKWLDKKPNTVGCEKITQGEISELPIPSWLEPGDKCVIRVYDSGNYTIMKEYDEHDVY